VLPLGSPVSLDMYQVGMTGESVTIFPRDPLGGSPVTLACYISKPSLPLEKSISVKSTNGRSVLDNVFTVFKPIQPVSGPCYDVSRLGMD